MWRKLLGAILALATTDVTSHAQKPLPFSCDDAVIPKQGKQGIFLPIFFLHGFDNDAYVARPLFDQLKRLNTPYACSIPLFENRTSKTTSLPKQIPAIIDFIRKKAATFDGHYQLVGHSMGALLFRAVLQEMDDHRAEHAILIAGPLEGFYGKILLAKRYGPIESIHELAYNISNQQTSSFANMWHDPNQEAKYLSSSALIPALDGHRKADESEDDHHKRLARYRSNFNRVKKIYLLASPADEMVIPWQTSHFGFYAQGSTEKIVPFDEQETSRTLGLDNMVAKNVTEMITFPDIGHSEWCNNADVVRQHVIPRLAKIGRMKK